MVAEEGYAALTMRRIAAKLDTGPATLYAHFANKAALDEQMLATLCKQIVLPRPDATRWREQMHDLAAQIRDAYLAYPGISMATLAVVPTNPETLRLSESMLAVMIAGGVSPQSAAWAVDAISLYVAAYCLEQAQWVTDVTASGGWPQTRDALLRRFDALPDSDFPVSKAYARELTAGAGHDRFDFTLSIMLAGLAQQ